jgi:hypothetical protein
VSDCSRRKIQTHPKFIKPDNHINRHHES